jgi:hypothetical protein
MRLTSPFELHPFIDGVPRAMMAAGAPGSSMTHIAMQEALDGKNVEWIEKVSDAGYGAD